ncbi:ribonuclease T [Suttonella sp. R2A3]|uniref:ribonuclease T n=1 Tax=Suttonella sp. R2A3 TaxID=2908648 RepID=UPI001F454717|nr:ribonuclease T [Suttonella sp. R2A3]UJF24885.1 ribonuclease T [Suttonella sp. R2A3]
MSDTLISQRFRNFLPVVVDVETGGFNSAKDALLEVAATFVNYDEHGHLHLVDTLHYHVKPFADANIDPESLKITGIDPYHPLRPAWDEAKVAEKLFGAIRTYQKQQGCSRTILVGHNAQFDLGFINALAERTNYQRNPFHPFSALDTVSLGALAYGQTVLARIAQYAGFEYDSKQAHGAKYDTELTAKIFCHIVNTWHDKVGALIKP